MDTERLSPAQVLSATGGTRKALRVYEKQGLLTQPTRTYTGRRRYSPKTVEEVRFLRAAVAVGLKLKDLKAPLTDWRNGRSACPALTPVLDRRMEEIERQLQALQLQRRKLKAIRQEWNCNCAGDDGICGQITKAS